MLLVLGLLVVGIPTVTGVVAAHEASSYFVFSPGTAPVITASSGCRSRSGELALPNGTPCVRLDIPQGKSHDVKGELLMVDVEVGQAGPLDWLEYQFGLLGGSRQLVPLSAYAGNTPASELSCQDSQQMSSANQDSALAALSALHYQARETALGAQVDTVYSGSPAWLAGVKCNDLITAVDGKPVRTSDGFVALLRHLPPGTTVVLTDHPAGGGAPSSSR